MVSVGLANCVTFYHPQKYIYCMVHGDDFVTTGPAENLDWFDRMLKGAFEIKTDRIGSDANKKKELKVLNRIIRYNESGIEI